MDQQARAGGMAGATARVRDDVRGLGPIDVEEHDAVDEW